jgi:UDPglucose 6-dehydrogenase
MTITVIGLGFVGLTTALGFCKKGAMVYGIDIDARRVGALMNLELPFHEPHLAEALREEVGRNFILGASLLEAVGASRAVIICVGTPGSADGSADLTCLLSAVEEVHAASDDEFRVVIVKSTVPPSSLSNQVKPFLDTLNHDNPRDIGLAANPEFLREGAAWEDFMNPDRIVIGVQDERSRELLTELYRPFNAPMNFVNWNSAEFIKYLSNTLLSTLISFSNEMAMIAHHIGAIDIAKAFKVLHQDRRWSGHPAGMASYVYPGCGYGGYCLPKDTAALKSIAEANGFRPRILTSNLEVNEEIADFVADRIACSVGRESRIGILGLAFKGGSDDVRLSPSKAIIEKLLHRGISNIVAYDPMANAMFARQYGLPITYANALEELVEEASHLVLLTNWQEFRDNQILLMSKRLFDFRYVFPEVPEVEMARPVAV